MATPPKFHTSTLKNGGKGRRSPFYLGFKVTFQGLLLLNFGREVTTWNTILYHFLPFFTGNWIAGFRGFKLMEIFLSTNFQGVFSRSLANELPSTMRSTTPFSPNFPPPGKLRYLPENWWVGKMMTFPIKKNRPFQFFKGHFVHFWKG